MILEHSSFSKPINPNQKIWRYVDFTKFVDLLNSKSIYFTRADKFEDVFEGSLSLRTVEFRNIRTRVIIDGVEIDDQNDWFSERTRKDREKYGINCWHMNDYESAAMWKLYLKSNEGIAIQSTYRNLNKVLKKSKYQFFLGTVNYIDYEKDDIVFDNSFLPFVHKRKSFSHENEIRAIIPIEAPANHNKIYLEDGGFKLRVNLNELIQNIYVSPDSPKWFLKLVTDTCKKFGYDFNVINSNLNNSPMY